MQQGCRIDSNQQDSAERAQAARLRFLEARNCLPARLLELGTADPLYPVRYSTRLESLCEGVRQTISEMNSAKSQALAGTVAHRTVFWEVDLQADFMLPGGRLYVPGAERIIPNVCRLVEAARRGCVFLVSSVDAHTTDDPELREWPPHCLKETPGAELIPEARALNCLVVPNRKGYVFLPDLGTRQQVLLQKDTLDVFDNPNTEVLLDFLSSTAAPASLEFVVFGVVTEYCVRCTVEGLLRRGHRVALVTDAVQSLKADEGQFVVNDLQVRGARLLTTDQALALVAAPLACSSLNQPAG
jgi:nicotinamidase/pyrazinamidase